MTIVITIVSFFAVIIVLILAHELGHFITAKATGVKVEEFGLFYPPRLLSFKRGGTVYSLNAIPLGGFVKMAGEEDPEVPGSLASKGIPTRLLVLSAGSLMNFLLPLLLFSIAFMVPYDVTVGNVTVKEVADGSPAVIAGMRPGDIILSISDKTVRNTGDVSRYLQLNIGNEIDIDIRHMDGDTETIQLTPNWKPPEGQESSEILVYTADRTTVRESYPFWRAIPLGFTSCIETLVLFKNGIVGMIIGAIPVDIAGPVGIAQVTGEIAEAGFSPLLEFAAFLSINFAIVNLFPIPALDGGRITFVLLELVRRGKRLSPKAEYRVHIIGFAMLMVFFLAVTFKDIMRIISGESLLS
ncbi:RIP metalloprotease [Chloroflexota bacterium]